MKMKTERRATRKKRGKVEKCVLNIYIQKIKSTKRMTRKITRNEKKMPRINEGREVMKKDKKHNV